MKAPVVAPAGIVMLAGVLVTNELLVERVTLIPPAGAGPLKVTVPVDGFPPATVVGLSDTEDRARVADVDVMVSAAVLLTLL